MSELFDGQVGGQGLENTNSKLNQLENAISNWKLKGAVETANAIANLRKSTQPLPLFKSTTQAAKDPGIFNNVSRFNRTTLPIKDLKEYNAELVKINKNATSVDKVFSLFTKTTAKDLKGLNQDALKPINESLKQTNKLGLDLFRESDSWAGTLKKTLGGIERSLENIAGITFAATSVKIFTDSFISLRNEIERVNSSLKLLNKSGFSLEMIESVNQFEDALLSLDTTNVEELATSFVSQYKNITTQLAQIGTLTQEEIRKSAEKGEDYLGDYFDKVQNMVETSLKSTVTSSDALAATYTALQAGLQEKGGQATVDTAVENSLKLVATQGGDANAVMELLVQTMTAFNLSASSTGDVLGKLNKLVDVGITSIPELQNGFGQLGVSASGAGVSFDEMAGGLAQLTLTGSTTFAAMTGLNNLFNKIRSGTVTERLAEIGATLDGQAVRFDTSTVAAKGFTKALDDVNRAIGGNIQSFQDILGGDQEAVRAGLGLLKTDIESLDQLINQIATASVKNLEDAFNIKINNDQVLQFEQILNRVSEIGLKLGKILAPLFSKGIDRIEKNIDRIGYLVKNYGALILKITELNLQMKAVNAMFGIMIGAILKLAGAYAVWFFASGKLQKNLGAIWNALTKKNEAIAKGNILWDKQTGMLKKVGAVIGQLVGVYDLERKGKAELTKEEIKRIEEEVKGRAVQAAAHQDTMRQLEQQREEYARLAKVKQNVNDVGVTGRQRIFQEGEEAVAKIKELETNQKVFQIEQKGRAEIDTSVRELESKQVLTELEGKKLELLRNVQKRDNDIQNLESEITDLKRLKKTDNPALIDARSNAIKERERDLKRLKEQREFDKFENDYELNKTNKTLKLQTQSERFVDRMDQVDDKGVSRREKVEQKYKTLKDQTTNTKEEEAQRQRKLRVAERLLTMDADISTSRDIRTLDNDRNARVERYRNERTLSYAEANRDNPTFMGKVERQKLANEGKRSAGENLTADLGNNLSALGSRVGGVFGGALSGAGSLMFGASGALSLTSSIADAKGAIVDPLKNDLKNTGKYLSGAFSSVTKGMGGLLQVLLKLVTPTTVVATALIALGAAIAKLTLTSEQKTNLANKLYEETGVTPSEKPKSILGQAKENLVGNAQGIGALIGGINKNYGKVVGSAYDALMTPFGLNRDNVGKLIKKTQVDKKAEKVGNTIFDPIKNYFNIGEKLNASNEVAQSDVLQDIFKQYDTLNSIESNTKNITTRMFGDVKIDKIGDKNYTKTINTILNKPTITNNDVDLANKVKQKTVNALNTRLNKENESLQIVGKNTDGLLSNSIANSGLNKEKQEQLDSFARKVIDERSRLKERLDNKEITQKDYDKSLLAVNTGTSNTFTTQEKQFFSETYKNLNDAAKRNLETAINEKTLLNEKTRLYEKEKSTFDAFSKAADSTQSFIKNLADVGNSSTPEARAAQLNLDSKIKSLGEQVANFAKVNAPKEGEVITTKNSNDAAQIFENLQNTIPGIVDTIVNNAASGFSDDTQKAKTLQTVIDKNVTAKFVERGDSAEEAKRKTNALLKQYQIQTQIMKLEDDDFQKQMDRLQKQKEVYEVTKQSEYLVTKKVIQDIQKIEIQALETQKQFQKKRVEELRGKVNTKGGLDSQVLIDAENELKTTEQNLITQRINQKRELLEYESKMIMDIYDKRYADIEEKVLKGESSFSSDERIKFEAEKQQEILKLNVQTQMQLRELLQKEGKYNKETQIRIEKEISQSRVQLLQSYIDEAKQRYDNLANKIQQLGDTESNYLSASINKLNTKVDIYDKLNQLIEQQKSLASSAQSSMENDANFIRNNLVSRRKQIDFEKQYYAMRKKALAEQIAFERQTLEVQKEQNKILIEKLKIEQDVAEKRAKADLKIAMIKEEQVLNTSTDPAEILAAQAERQIAELNMQVAVMNRDNVRAQEILMNNQTKLDEYNSNVRAQQSNDEIDRTYAENTLTKKDDILLAKQAMDRWNNGGYAQKPELETFSPSSDKGKTQTAQEIIAQTKDEVMSATVEIGKDLKENRKKMDEDLKIQTNVKKLQEKIGTDLTSFKDAFTKYQDSLLKDQKEIIEKQGKVVSANEAMKTAQDNVVTSVNATKDIQASIAQKTDRDYKIQELILQELKNLYNPQPKEESVPTTQPTEKEKTDKAFSSMEKIIQKMLSLSGVETKDRPTIRFNDAEMMKGAAGVYYPDKNTIVLPESAKEGVLSGDTETLKTVIHEVRHWMQDQGYNNGWLDPSTVKDPFEKERIKRGIAFSGNNKGEKDAYTYETLYGNNIIKTTFGGSFGKALNNNVNSLYDVENPKQQQLVVNPQRQIKQSNSSGQIVADDLLISKSKKYGSVFTQLNNPENTEFMTGYLNSVQDLAQSANYPQIFNKTKYKDTEEYAKMTPEQQRAYDEKMNKVKSSTMTSGKDWYDEQYAKQLKRQKESAFKYQDDQNKILAGLNMNNNLAEKVNGANNTTNNKTESKTVNVTLSPKIEITIDKESDKTLAETTAKTINEHLFNIFNEVAYQL
jgi:hypothetical protein